MKKTNNKKFNLFYAKVTSKRFVISLMIILFIIATAIAIVYSEVLKGKVSEQTGKIIDTISLSLVYTSLIFIPVIALLRHLFLLLTRSKNHYKFIRLCSNCRKEVLDYKSFSEAESSGSSYSGSIGGESFSVGSGIYYAPPTAKFVCPRCDDVTNVEVSENFVSLESVLSKQQDRQDAQSSKIERREKLAELNRIDKENKKNKNK